MAPWCASSRRQIRQRPNFLKTARGRPHRLQREYFRVVEVEGQPFSTLVVELKFGRNRQRVITGVKRVSRPGRRVYARKDRLPRVLGGLGTAILSTSTGLITSRQAAERGIGGEVIAFVW